MSIRTALTQALQDWRSIAGIIPIILSLIGLYIMTGAK